LGAGALHGQSLPSYDCFGGEVASVKSYLGGRSSRSSRISIPLKTTLWSAFTYAVRLLCLCEIVRLKSYLGAGAVFSHTGFYRAMHFSAKRGIAITCLSVRPSVRL